MNFDDAFTALSRTVAFPKVYSKPDLMVEVLKQASAFSWDSVTPEKVRELADTTPYSEILEEEKTNMKLYLASPFFNVEENKHVTVLEDVLRAKGFTVFSPRENQLPEFELGGYEWRTNVFRNDIHHIMWSDAVIAIIGDNYDDTGTAWEIGYAYAMGKPVYLYNPTGNIINLMLTDSTHGYFESVSEIIDYDFETAPIKPYMGDVK